MTLPRKNYEAIINSDKRFELLVNSISDYAIYLLDPDGHIVSWNEGAKRFKGYSFEEVEGQHFSLFFTTEDRAKALPEFALEQASKNRRFEADGWRIRKDGTRFWANVVVDAIYNEQGELIGYAKITKDITERKFAQDKLLESEQRFRFLVEGVADYAIYMLSPEGIVTNWNLGAERIKGYSAEEIIGSHFSMFLTPEDREAGIPARSLKIAAAEGRYEHEGWRVRKDGTQFRAHVIIDAIHNDDKELIGFAKITRDITEKYRAEESLAKANAALFQSQKMDAIGNLTGGIAHDFNNLLSVISNGLEIFALSNVDARQLKMVDSMKRAVARGATLTQQLLSFARKQPLNSEVHTVNQLINSFEPMLQRAIGSNIELSIELYQNMPPVLVDSTRFEASLLNLVVNARDAMLDGGKIHISTLLTHLDSSQTLPAGDYVKVMVSDTGTGISPEHLKQVLEPFFTTKEIGKGSGLGLSQVLGFAQQSGGDVVIESDVGRGTTVSMLFPALQAETALSAPAEKVEELVLIVDDEPDLLASSAEVFKALGYDVITATNGEEALEVIRKTQGIMMMFTDVLMPGALNGIQLARKVRDIHPALQIILASGYPLPALQQEHGSIDEFTFINKPYSLAEIAKTIRIPASIN